MNLTVPVSESTDDRQFITDPFSSSSSSQSAQQGAHFPPRLPLEKYSPATPAVSSSPTPSSSSRSRRPGPAREINSPRPYAAGRAASVTSHDSFFSVRDSTSDISLPAGSVIASEEGLTRTLPGEWPGQTVVSQSTQSSPDASYSRLNSVERSSPSPLGSNSRSIQRRRQNSLRQRTLSSPIPWDRSSTSSVQRTASPTICGGRRSQPNHSARMSPSSSHREGTYPLFVAASGVSKFVLRNKRKRTLDTIEHKIVKLLLKGPGKISPSEAAYGNVYILTRRESDGFVKIGKTAGEVSARMCRISPRDQYGHLTPHIDECYRPFKHFELAEGIIKEELYNRRYVSHFTVTPNQSGSPASPGVEQGKTEWYMMEPAEAEEIMVRWRDWLYRCDPYDRNGKLKGYWHDVISQRGPYDKAKHGGMSTRWSALLKPPTRYQLAKYYLTWCLAAFRGGIVYIRNFRK